MSPADKILALALVATLLAIVILGLWHEHQLEKWRATLDEPVVTDEYLRAIDEAVTAAAFDEIAARRALRPHGQVENVVPLYPRKKDGAA